MARLKGEEANVPLSAMMDVVFLLLIYFVFTQKPIVEDVHLGSDLPASDARPVSSPVPPFKIDVVDDNGSENYRIEGRKISFEQLKKRVENFERDVTVIIHCDPNAKHEKLIRLLDMLTEKEFSKLNITDDVSVAFRR